MSARGFTLFELLVVLAIMALFFGIALPRFSKALPSVQLKDAALEIAAGLRGARSRAIARNQQSLFVLDLASRRFAISGAQAVQDLPEGVELSLIAPRAEQLGDQRGAIRFFPDGSSTGGRVGIKKGVKAYYVGVDWLTGRTTIQAQSLEP